MASPFPGMDPYIEGESWTSFHTQFGVEIARELSPKLAPRYIARAEKRYLVENPDELMVEIDQVIPDVAIRETMKRPARSGGTALAKAPLEIATILPGKVPHVWVEIRDVKHRKLVTAVEILSPTNKSGRGRRDYLRKRHELLRSSAHLLEIDLVRRGRRLPMKKKLPGKPYFVFVTRVERRPITEIWPVAFNGPLPTVPVPLLAEDADVPLDLQAALTSVYDTFHYELEIDYSMPPDVALPPKAAAWAKRLLRKA